ncbi:DUF5958 family protein [Streptomyces sp. NPDC059118]|uniref:DUF5958 family protein n=1 Tax=unclassified Streptomyces TaxID=2593676 RepID=UPI0036A3A1FB
MSSTRKRAWAGTTHGLAVHGQRAARRGCPVLARCRAVRIAGGEPGADHVKAFRVLVSVFAIADTRRRKTRCKGVCGHAWHNLPAATEQP